MEAMHIAYVENYIDYTDTRPDVEISVEIKEVSDFDLHTGIFSASFIVTLDWEESEFIEGVHYHQDGRSKEFVISQSVLEDYNSFNPCICIANAVDGPDQFERVSEPKIQRLMTRQKSASGESVWVTKQFRFNGRLQCSQVDGTQFPWDMQRLPLQVKSLPMEGETTLGQPRDVRLVEPRLRKMEVVEKGRRKKVDKTTVFRYDDLSQDPNLHTVEAHKWSMVDQSNLGDDPVPNFVVGEMKVCAFGGSDPAPNEYHVEIVLVRAWTHYFFDFQIQMLLVVVSMCTAWVPFSPDSVPNRLSISMTIVLAIVFFATSKPPAISDLTYSTMHDFFDQVMLFISVMGCIENVFVYVQCYGMDRRNVNDWELGVGNLLPHSLCEEGFMGASLADQWFIIFMFVVMLGFFTQLIVKAQLYRLRFLAQAQQELGACDLNVEDNIGWKVVGTELAASQSAGGTLTASQSKTAGGTLGSNRLMLTASDVRAQMRRTSSRAGAFFEFSFEESKDAHTQIALCIARHSMPMLYIFPRWWTAAALGRTACHRCCSCRCRRRPAHEYTAVGKSTRTLQASGDSSDRTMRSERSLESPLGMVEEERPDEEWLQKYYGARPKLDSIARIVDCGTGEAGFYEYRVRQRRGATDEKPMVFMEKSTKKSYGAKGQPDTTFMEEYVLKEDGPRRFAELLAKEFFPEDERDRLKQSGASNFSGLQSMSASRGTNQQQLGLPTDGQAKRGRCKIFLGPTGGNRDKLITSRQTAEKVVQWRGKVEQILNENLQIEHAGIQVDFLFFVPTAEDEATYELIATEFLVQRGDLRVSDIPTGHNKVPFAGAELNQALMRAGKARAKSGGSGTMFSFQEFIREFQDLMDSEIDEAKMKEWFDLAKDEDSLFAEAAALSEVIREEPQLMRALIKNRLFNGTLSAGGGSCQITVKPDHEERVQLQRPGIAGNRPNSPPDGHLSTSGQPPPLTARSTSGHSNQVLRTSEFHSVSVGNKTPLIADPSGYAMFPKTDPITKDLLDAWREKIKDNLVNKDLPYKLQGNLRGVYVGISAIFYAAKSANCQELLLPKAEFLKRLEAKLEDLLAEVEKQRRIAAREAEKDQKVYDHKEFANLVLVHTLVSHVLAETAWIVCKRNWRADPASVEKDSKTPGDVWDEPEEKLPEYVATWSLGFYLNQTS